MPTPGSDQRGFTLVEVIVALGILAVAILAMMKAVSEGIVTTNALRDRFIAGVIAENRLVETHAAPQLPDIGTRNGRIAMADQDWLWSETIATTNDPAIVRLEVTVKASGDGPQLASLTAFRRKP
ncbi:MAG: type II secretion system minor pseudopilin GspI [Rhodospirillaceae bacterium]|nr:type II secretion system minor pseudopilin GspI [Rhodospirillaceae bacterium]